MERVLVTGEKLEKETAEVKLMEELTTGDLNGETKLMEELDIKSLVQLTFHQSTK